MKTTILYLVFACLAAFSAEKDEVLTISELFDTYPAQLVQKGRMSDNDEAFFKKWHEDQIDKEISVKIRWDGGHKGGYCSVKIGKHTFPVHLTFKYSGKMPKAPRSRFKMREIKCRKGGGVHYKVTRTGKEIEITGKLVAITKYPNLCTSCGKPDLVKIELQAKKVE